MDGPRFDRLTRWLGDTGSRRAMLRGLVAAVVAGTGAASLTPEAGAARCRNRGQKCNRPTDCCSRSCRRAGGTGKRRRCKPGPKGRACRRKQRQRVCQPGIAGRACRRPRDCRSGVCSCGGAGTDQVCWAPTWTQGFEQNLNGWYARIPRLGGGPGDLEPATRAMRRRPANNIPIPPASGAFVGQLYGQVDAIDFNSVAALTTWGGYKQTLPAGGYTVSLDVYLAPIEHDDPNALFTYAVTATNPDTCQPVGDVFFRAGNQTEGNETLFCVSINDNGPKGPACEGPATIIFDRDPSSSGWYTFVVEYFANTVANQMTARAYVTLLNGQNTLPVTFVVPGGYGGNQYAWFPYINAFDAVYIDNAVRTTGGVSPT